MAGVLTAISMWAAPGSGHEHATGVVKERMDMMEAMAKSMKVITDRIKNKRDLAAVKTEAEAIAEHAPHMTHLFPPGSRQPPTDARATIWQSWPDFEGKARALAIESAKLAKMDLGNFAAVSAQVEAVSRSCTACHAKYRVKK
jgi:cytochrome c556